MPRLAETSLINGAVSGFQFSGIRPEKLGSSEYTLATILVDVSGSVSGFQNILEESVRAAVEACKASPRSENILLRMIAFNETQKELFGFSPLADIDDSMLKLPNPSGGTALLDAFFAAASGSNAYGKQLYDQDYLVNSVSFVITDGDDTSSRMPMITVRDEVGRGKTEEWLESAEIALIGVNAKRYSAALNSIAQGLGLGNYLDSGDASAKNLAKLARFISKSISLASKSLMTGSGVGAGLMGVNGSSLP